MANKVIYGSVRPENGRKMLETEANITEMMDYMSRQMDVDQRELTRQANKALYELAEKRGKSLWSLCYEVMPNWKIVDRGFEPSAGGNVVGANMEWGLELIPLRIDWQRGEGYWEKKYKDLKEQLQKLLEEKKE